MFKVSGAQTHALNAILGPKSLNVGPSGFLRYKHSKKTEGLLSFPENLVAARSSLSHEGLFQNHRAAWGSHGQDASFYVSTLRTA